MEAKTKTKTNASLFTFADYKFNGITKNSAFVTDSTCIVFKAFLECRDELRGPGQSHCCPPPKLSEKAKEMIHRHTKKLPITMREANELFFLLKQCKRFISDTTRAQRVKLQAPKPGAQKAEEKQQKKLKRSRFRSPLKVPRQAPKSKRRKPSKIEVIDLTGDTSESESSDESEDYSSSEENTRKMASFINTR